MLLDSHSVDMLSARRLSGQYLLPLDLLEIEWTESSGSTYLKRRPPPDEKRLRPFFCHE